MKIDPSKSAVQNLLALIDASNPSAPTLPNEVTVGNLQTGSYANGGDTKVTLTGKGPQGTYANFVGSVDVTYKRLTLAAEAAAPAGAINVPYGASSATILASIASQLGFLPSEISFVSPPTAPGTLPGTNTATIQSSGSFLYEDGTTPISLAWASQAYQDVVLSDAPYAYWPLTDASGTVATDVSGNLRHGAYQGAVTLGSATLVPNTAKKYTKLPGASTAYVDVTAAKSFCSGSAWSIECWVNVTSYAQQNIASSAQGVTLLSNVNTSSPAVGLDWTLSSSQSNKFWYWPANLQDKYSAANAIPATGAVSHIVLTFSSGTLSIYLNGALVGSAITGATAPSATSFLQIGAPSWTGGAMNGLIGEVALYTTALSAARVLAHYNAGHNS